MTDSNGYLSKDKPYLAKLQRERRARLIRIDYMPSRDAVAIIAAKRGRYYSRSTNGGILDAILIEWAELTGIKYREETAPKSSVAEPDGLGTVRARMTSEEPLSAWAGDWLARMRAKSKATRRVTCGARTQNGKPCRGKSQPGKRRCKWHGGCSTGPRTAEGKLRALANLRQFRDAQT